jgi:hypothetical protein
MIDLLKWLDSILTFANVASMASIAGFLVSLFVYLTVRNIRREFLFRARLPMLHKSLQKHASQLSRYLQDYDNYRDFIDEELSLAEVNVASLHNKARGPLRKNLGGLTADIKEYRNRKTPNSKSDLRSIYLKLNMRIQEITNLRADEQWGENNG